jgi:hypothetical protein
MPTGRRWTKKLKLEFSSKNAAIIGILGVPPALGGKGLLPRLTLVGGGEHKEVGPRGRCALEVDAGTEPLPLFLFHFLAVELVLLHHTLLARCTALPRPSRMGH